MAVVDGNVGRQSYANHVSAVPQLIPGMIVGPQAPKCMDGDFFFSFERRDQSFSRTVSVLHGVEVPSPTSLFGC